MLRTCQAFPLLVAAFHFAPFSPCSINALELASDEAMFEKHEDNKLTNLL